MHQEAVGGSQAPPRAALGASVRVAARRAGSSAPRRSLGAGTGSTLWARLLRLRGLDGRSNGHGDKCSPGPTSLISNTSDEAIPLVSVKGTHNENAWSLPSCYSDVAGAEGPPTGSAGP